MVLAVQFGHHPWCTKMPSMYTQYRGFATKHCQVLSADLGGLLSVPLYFVENDLFRI